MSHRYNPGGGNRSSSNNSSNDPYDFDVSDELTESTDETSSQQQSFTTSGSRNNNNKSASSYTRGTSSSLYGRNNTSHSSRFDALSPPTDSDESSSLSSEASPILRTNGSTVRGNSGSPSRRNTNRFGTTSSTNTTLNRTVSSNNLSIEERVAARLAKLNSERQQKISSAPNSAPNSVPNSLNTTAVSINSNNNNSSTRPRSSSVTRNNNEDDINDSNDNEEDNDSFNNILGSTNLTTVSRGRNLGGNGSTINSTYSTINNRSINSTYQSKPILGSPLSPGEVDSSSSIDLSSGDFQVGAIAARALAARRAAAQNSNTNSVITETQRRDEESEDISISTDNDNSTESHHRYTSKHHHTRKRHDDEGDESFEDENDENEQENQNDDTGTTEHEESNESSSIKKNLEGLPRSNTSPFRGIQPSNTNGSTITHLSPSTAATTTVSPTKTSGNKFSFADIAMMMRQAALDAKRASSTDVTKMTNVSGSSSTMVPKDTTNTNDFNYGGGRNRVSTLGSLEGSLDDNRPNDSGRDTANSDLPLGSESRNSNATTEIDAGPYRPAIISFGDFVTQGVSSSSATTITTAAPVNSGTGPSLSLSNPARSSFNNLPTVTVTTSSLSTPNDTGLLHTTIDTNAVLARNLRAAASAALSKQLQAITTAQNKNTDTNEPLQPPSVLLQQYVSNANDTAEVDEPEEVIPPPPPTRGRNTSVPLRAQPIRNAMNEIGFTHRRNSSNGYNSGYTSRSRSRSASVNNDQMEHPRLPRPIRMTNAHVARSVIARDYVASHPEPEKYRQALEDIRTHKHSNQGKDINFHLVTHGGEYLVGVMRSPQMIKNGNSRSRSSSVDGGNDKNEQENSSDHHEDHGLDHSQDGTDKDDDTQELPGSTQKLYMNTGEEDDSNENRPNGVQHELTMPKSFRNHSSLHHHHPPPPNNVYGREDPYSVANALIADAAAARYRAENQVKELQAALSELETRLTSSEAGTGNAKNGSTNPTVGEAAELRPAPASISLYTLLREAVTNLTIHRPVPLNDAIGEKNVYSVKRFIKDRENSHRSIRREWGPTVPTTDGDDTQNNTTVTSIFGPSAPTGFFNELPVAEAAAAANNDGYRAYVPLELIASLQSELLAQEKMLNAYHADNERLHEQLTVAKERAEVAENATQLATADALAAAQAVVSANSLVTTLHQNTTSNHLDRTGILDPNNNILSNGTDNALLGTGSAALEIERLRSELAHVREESRLRQEELAYEVDRLRKAKMDLECKVAGVDMTAVSKDAEEVVKLRAALQEANLSYDREISGLRTKLDWYRDNQAIIDADAATISHQAETIRDLQNRIWNLQTEKVSGKSYRPSSPRAIGKESTIVNNLVTPKKGSSPTSGSDRNSPTIGSPRSSSAFIPVTSVNDPGKELVLAHQRIKELERNLSVAEEALSKRYPDSIANLIREAKGADGAVGEPAAVLAELENLKATSTSKEEIHDRALRSLRQEHERIRAEYERREGTLKDEISALRVRLAALGDTGSDDIRNSPTVDGLSSDLGSTAVVSKRELALRNKVKELETELERVRTFYQKKVKDERSNVGSSPTTVSNKGISSTSRTNTPVPPSVPSSVTPTNGVDKKDELPTKPSTMSSTVSKDKPKVTNATLSSKGTSKVDTKSQSKSNPSGSREPSPTTSRRSSVSSAVSSTISKVSANKPSLPSVPKIPSSSKSKSTLSTSKDKKETVVPSVSSSKTVPKESTITVTPLENVSTTGNNTNGTINTSTNDSPQRIQELLLQVARLEAENTQLKSSTVTKGTNDSSLTEPTTGSIPSVVSGNTVEASLATAAVISSSARTTQENLQRQVDQLYSAISILETRAEAREMELARAETSVRRAREAAEVLARTQYEDALRAKDDALRAAKAEVQELMGIVLTLQQQQQFLQNENIVNTSMDWDENNLTTRTVIPQATELFAPKDSNAVHSNALISGGSPGGALRGVPISSGGAFRNNSNGKQR